MNKVMYKKVEEYEVKEKSDDFQDESMALTHAKNLINDHNVISDIHIQTPTRTFTMNNIHKD